MTAQEYLKAKQQEKLDKEQAITKLASIDKSIAIMKTRPDLDTPEIRKGILANRQKALELTRPTGKIDTGEWFTRQYEVAQSIPYLPTKDTRELVFKIAPLVVKLKKGEELSLDDNLTLQDWYNENESDAERGRTVAADAWNIIATLPAFYGEFGIGKKLVGDAAKKVGTNIVKSILKEYSEKSFGEFAAKSAGVLASGAAMAATTGAGMSYTSAAQNYVNTEDSALKSAYKGFVDAWAENTGEQTGAAMASVFGKITKKVLPQGSKLYNTIAKVDNAAIGKKAGKFLEKVGYNGTLEEMGEERFSAMMRAVLGTGEFSEVIPSGRQLATEAIAFAVPGAVGGGLQSIDAARNSVKERTFRLSYEGASDYADKNPDDAAYLAGIQSPSRTDFEKVGLKGYNQQQRQQFADQMRKFEADKPVAVESPAETPTAEPQNEPVVEEVSQPVSEQPVVSEQAVEVDTALQEMRQQIIDAGRPVEEADANIELARAMAGVISRQTGKPVNDIVTQWNIDIKSGKSKAEVTQKVDEIIAPTEATLPAETTATPERQINHNAKLPAILTGAKPQYGYRDKQFTLTWSSDIDKAFYITGQKTKSKRDKEYRKFLKDNGFTDAEIDTIGQQVRDNIKATASKRTESGNIVVPNITAQIFKPKPVKKAPVNKPVTPKADVPSVQTVPVSEKPVQEVTLEPIDEEKQTWEMTQKEYLSHFPSKKHNEKPVQTARKKLKEYYNDLILNGVKEGHLKRTDNDFSAIDDIGTNLIDQYESKRNYLTDWIREQQGQKAMSAATENYDIDNHKRDVYRAIRENKPVPLNVLQDYKGEKWVDEAIAKLQSPSNDRQISVKQAPVIKESLTTEKPESKEPNQLTDARDAVIQQLTDELMDKRSLKYGNVEGKNIPLVMLHKSSRQGVKLQLSYFGQDGKPSAHTNYTDVDKAIKDFIANTGGIQRFRPDIPKTALLGINEGEYYYESLERPVFINTVPKEGFIRTIDNGNYGIVVFNKPLTTKQIRDYKLKPIGWYSKDSYAGDKHTFKKPLASEDFVTPENPVTEKPVEVPAEVKAKAQKVADKSGKPVYVVQKNGKYAVRATEPKGVESVKVEPQGEVIPEYSDGLPIGGIYRKTMDDKQWFGVRGFQGGKDGYGNHLYETLQDAEEESKDVLKDKEQRDEDKRLADEKKQKDASDAEARKFANKGKTPAQIMAEAKAEKVLSKPTKRNGVYFKSTKEWLDKSFIDGAVAKIEKEHAIQWDKQKYNRMDNREQAAYDKRYAEMVDERRLYDKDGAFFVISKTEYDYFQSLSKVEPKKEVAPVAEAVSEQGKQPWEMTVREYMAENNTPDFDFGQTVKRDRGRVVDARSEVKEGDYILGTKPNDDLNGVAKFISGVAVKVYKQKVTLKNSDGIFDVADKIFILPPKSIEYLKAREEHANSIKQALSENKPVPLAVLQDYAGEEWADTAIKQQSITLSQSSQSNKRGEIRFTDNGAVITLLENADASTLPHELAHFFLRDMAKSTTAEVQADMAIIRKWLNNKGDTFTTEQEERFARAFEAYLRKGKAPTTALQRVFDNFKAWLSQVYKRATDLKVVLSPEITGVFDRMMGGNSENPNILNQSAVEEPDTEQTSAKNKFTEEQMRKLTTQMFGDNIPNEQTKHYGDVIQNAVDKEYDKNALDIAETVLNKGIILNDEQVVGLSIRALELSNQRHKALLDIAATTDANEKEMLMTQYNRIEADMAKIYNALNVTGTDTGRALAVRRIMIDNANEWTLPTLLAAAEAKKGKPLTEKDVDNTTNWFNKYTEKSKEFDAVVIELRKEKATNIIDVISKVWTRNMDKTKAEQYVSESENELAELLKNGCYNG